MNIFTATEVAYKNGYEAGVKDCLNEILAKFDVDQKAIIMSKEAVYFLAKIFNVDIEGQSSYGKN